MGRRTKFLLEPDKGGIDRFNDAAESLKGCSGLDVKEPLTPAHNMTEPNEISEAIPFLEGRVIITTEVAQSSGSLKGGANESGCSQ